MARVFSPSILMHRGAAAPSPSGSGTFYPIVIPNITTGAGLSQFDVLCAMFGRVVQWRFSFSFTISATYLLDPVDNVVLTVNGSASGTIDSTDYAYSSSAPSFPSSEKHFAYGEETVIEDTIGSNTGYGSFSAVVTSDVDPTETTTGDYNVDFVGIWNDGVYPIIVTSAGVLYAHFGGSFNFVAVQNPSDPVVLSQYSSANFQVKQDDPVTQILNGGITMTTPNWRSSGTSGIVIPTYDNKDLFAQSATSRTVSFSATAAPIACLPHGLDPANPNDYTTINRIWNDNGSAARNPLDP